MLIFIMKVYLTNTHSVIHVLPLLLTPRPKIENNQLQDIQIRYSNKMAVLYNSGLQAHIQIGTY